MSEPSVSTPTEEEDGFGDFDAAAPPGPSIVAEDDGFGDFDAAPPSAVDEPSVATPTEEDDLLRRRSTIDG